MKNSVDINNTLISRLHVDNRDVYCLCTGHDSGVYEQTEQSHRAELAVSLFQIGLQ